MSSLPCESGKFLAVAHVISGSEIKILRETFLPLPPFHAEPACQDQMPSVFTGSSNQDLSSTPSLFTFSGGLSFM